MQVLAKTIFDLLFVRLLLLLLFVSSFDILSNLADMTYYHVVVITTLLFVFSYFIYYFFDIFRRQRVSKFTLLQITVVILFAVPIYKALIIFNQPLFYGVLSQVSFLLCFSSLMLLELLRRKIISIKKVERFFVVISFITLAVYMYFNFFVDPLKYVESHLVALNDLRGYRFRFSSALIVMLYFYSLFKAIRNRSLFYLIVHIVTICYFLFLYQSRTYIVTIAITTIVFLMRNISSRFLVKWSLAGIVVLALSLFFLQQLRPDVIEKYQALYTNALLVFYGESTEEYSTNARIKQFNIAIDHILKHPILGNGMIANRWNDSWRGIFGYFYPSDIGIFGTLFVFGVLGTGIFIFLFFYGFRLSKQIKSRDIFLLTAQYTMLFLFFTLFFTAYNIKNASLIYFLLAIIYYFRYYHTETSGKIKGAVLPDTEEKQLEQHP